MADAPTEGTQTPQAGGEPAILRDRYLIFPSTPLADFSTITAQAFLAEDRRDPGASLYAMISHPQLPPRTNAMRLLKGVQSPGLNQLVEWGVVPWAPAGGECMATIYARPASGRLMADMAVERRLFGEMEVTRKIVLPIVTALREFETRGLTHRAIRPTNMFYFDAERERVVLGDCASSPAAIDQPYIFETVESSMCHPAARGEGRLSDDLYALGVSILILTLGRNPLSHLDDDDVIRLKMAKGSYSALVGEQRLPLALIEVLRGLLCDDPVDRWRLDSVEMWLSGRRLSPLQTKREKRAGRAFLFNGQEYFNARDLAAAFSNNWEQAITQTGEGRLEMWLRRSLDDKDKADLVAIATAEAAGAVGERHAANDVMMAKVCMILDNKAPIRYKGFNAMPDGFGTYLAYLFLQQEDPRLFAEAVLREVPKLWLSNSNPFQNETVMIEARFRTVRGYLLQTSMGYGLERALYELNESISCQSPLVGEDYVFEIKQLLPALDKTSKVVNQKTLPIDRHIAAFIACRFSQDVEKQLNVLNDPSPEHSGLGVLGLLASLQWHLGIDAVTGLAAWLGGLLGPAINNFHDRGTRKMLEKEMPKLIRSGSLVEMYRMLDNPEIRLKDKNGFAMARNEYAIAQQKIADLESGQGKEEEIDRVGKQTAALLSALLALASIILFTMMKVG